MRLDCPHFESWEFVRIQHAGTWQAGHAEIRCLYAPEFSAHTASTHLDATR